MDATTLTVAVLTLTAGSVGIAFALYRQLGSLETERKREREEFTKLAERTAALEEHAKASERYHAEVTAALKAIAETQGATSEKFAVIDRKLEWILAAPAVKYQTRGQDGKPVEQF